MSFGISKKVEKIPDTFLCHQRVTGNIEKPYFTKTFIDVHILCVYINIYLVRPLLNFPVRRNVKSKDFTIHEKISEKLSIFLEFIKKH